MRSLALRRVPSVMTAVAVALLLVGAGAAPARGGSGSVAVIASGRAGAATGQHGAVITGQRGTWTWPVAPPHPIARAYLAPPTRYGAGHRGIDIRAPDGVPVLAPADGVAHFSGVVVDRPVLSIEHPGGVLSSFEPVTSPLHPGDRVRRGDVVGTLVRGHCAEVCLHLGARIDGEYVNPLLFLGGVPHAVLYPTR